MNLTRILTFMISFLIGLTFILTGVEAIFSNQFMMGLIAVLAGLSCITSTISSYRKRQNTQYQESYNEEEYYESDTEYRLREAEDLFRKGLISMDEYAKKREEILKDL